MYSVLQNLSGAHAVRSSCTGGASISVCLLCATSAQASITAHMQTDTAGSTAEQVSAGDHSMCIWQVVSFPPRCVNE